MKGHEKYGELAPDVILETFAKRIADCIERKEDYSVWTSRLYKVNGKLPDFIKELTDTDAVKNAVSKIEAITKVPEKNHAGTVSQIIIDTCVSTGSFEALTAHWASSYSWEKKMVWYS